MECVVAAVRCGASAVLLLLLTLSSPAAHGQTQPAEADRNPAQQEVEKQLAALDRDTPVAQELVKIQSQLEKIAAEREGLQAALYRQIEKLRETDAYVRYAEKRHALEEKQSAAWEEERAEMAVVARTLYASRHDELQKLGAPPLIVGPELGLDVLIYPRIDGSTSAHPLSVVVASRLLGVPYRWVYPDPTGRPWGRGRLAQVEDLFLPVSGFASSHNYEFNLATSRTVAYPEKPSQERLAVMINSLLAVSTTTHDALVNLGTGKCDLVLTVRPPTAGERKAVAEHNHEIRLEPIAREALIFIVHHENEVKSLLLDEVRAIYSLKTKRWPNKVAGAIGKEIAPLMREPESGSRELFDQLVMKGTPAPDGGWARELYSTSMIGPYNRVTTDKEAIGYSVWYYERFMALSPFTRTIAIDGIEPTAETIASGRYPLVFPLYAAYRASDSPKSPARKLLDWLKSDEGQAVVRESGYVTLR